MLLANEQIPLMGQLPRGQQMLSLCTSLYNTPLFPHALPFTDYLLTLEIER